MTFREIDQDRVVLSDGEVVFGDFLTELADLKTNGGISTGIIGRGSPDAFNPNCIFLKLLSFARQRLFGKVFQKTPLRLRRCLLYTSRCV